MGLEWPRHLTFKNFLVLKFMSQALVGTRNGFISDPVSYNVPVTVKLK